MKTSGLSLYMLFAGCVAIAACSQTTRLQYTPNVNLVSNGGARQLSYSLLYSFREDPDGNNPSASLIDVRGTLYGTTYQGGAYGYGGTVFSITPDGTAKVLHSFGNGADGRFPVARLIDVKGRLYGTTYQGGKYDSGTVFSITTGGEEKVLHSFLGPEGRLPEAGLIEVNGTLYGTTQYGGAYDDGTVFRITTHGAEKVLHSFSNTTTDGGYPAADLVDVAGTLYGTTQYGGKYCVASSQCGTVFSITTGGTEKLLHSFGNGNDGRGPVAGMVDVSGTLYGTTGAGGKHCAGSGCGTVFSVTTDGAEKVLHSFGSGSDGAYPAAGLIDVGGTLYGVTNAGGNYCVPYGCGTVFRITTDGAEKVLHSFLKRAGDDPAAGLIYVSGTLYGTTYEGGASGAGTVFSLTR